MFECLIWSITRARTAASVKHSLIVFFSLCKEKTKNWTVGRKIVWRGKNYQVAGLGPVWKYPVDHADICSDGMHCVLSQRRAGLRSRRHCLDLLFILCLLSVGPCQDMQTTIQHGPTTILWSTPAGNRLRSKSGHSFMLSEAQPSNFIKEISPNENAHGLQEHVLVFTLMLLKLRKKPTIQHLRFGKLGESSNIATLWCPTVTGWGTW